MKILPTIGLVGSLATTAFAQSDPLSYSLYSAQRDQEIYERHWNEFLQRQQLDDQNRRIYELERQQWQEQIDRSAGYPR